MTTATSTTSVFFDYAGAFQVAEDAERMILDAAVKADVKGPATAVLAMILLRDFGEMSASEISRHVKWSLNVLYCLRVLADQELIDRGNVDSGDKRLRPWGLTNLGRKKANAIVAALKANAP